MQSSTSIFPTHLRLLSFFDPALVPVWTDKPCCACLLLGVVDFGVVVDCFFSACIIGLVPVEKKLEENKFIKLTGTPAWHGEIKKCNE